jgi:hypothetical protein
VVRELLWTRAMLRTLVWLPVACAASPPAPPAAPPPLVHHQVVEMHGGGTAAAPDDLGASQPAFIKLKLGHYRNVERGVSVTIDLTDGSRIPRAKIRFDHEPHVIEAEGQPGPRGRTDYLRANGRIVLQAWEDGRRTVFIFDPDALTTSGPIALERDGDADAL